MTARREGPGDGEAEPRPQRWCEQRYWTDALEAFAVLRSEGVRRLELDLVAIESAVVAGDGPAYRALEAFADIHRHEGFDSYRSASRLMMALVLRLAMCSESEAIKPPA